MSQPLPPPSPPPPEPRSVRLDALRSFHDDLCRALGVVAPRAGPPAEVTAAGLGLQCEQCGLQITGAEWLAVLQAQDPSVLGDARLSRFQQGYCGRKDCSSYYYRVSFGAVPGVDWGTVLSQVGQLPPPQPTADAEPPPSPVRLHSRRQLAIRLGLGAAAIGILLLVRRLWTGGSIPLVKPARKFTVEPSSVPPPQPGK